MFTDSMLLGVSAYTRPVYIDSKQANASTGTSRVVSAPTGLLGGDFLYASCWSGHASDVWVPPLGWDLVADKTGINASIALFAKRASFGEPSTYTFSGTQSTNWWISVFDYRGATRVSANNLAGMTVAAADPQVAASMAVQEGRILLAQVGVNNSSVTLTSGPAGMTLRKNNFAGFVPRGAIYELVNPSNGASGAKSFDISSALFGGAFLVEIE